MPLTQKNSPSTTRTSPLHLLTGMEGATPVLRSLVRDVALENSHPNREAMMTLRKQRASELLTANQHRQDCRVNEKRKEPRPFAVGEFVFVGKASQATGKLDSGMRGPVQGCTRSPSPSLRAGAYGWLIWQANSGSC